MWKRFALSWILIITYFVGTTAVSYSYASMHCSNDNNYVNTAEGYHDNEQTMYFVNGVNKSDFVTTPRDRQWKWRYCQQNAEPLPFVNLYPLDVTSFSGKWSRDCPNNSAIIGATSNFNGADRAWTYHCGQLDETSYVLTYCSDTGGYVNSLYGDFSFFCGANGVMTGVYSRFFPSYNGPGNCCVRNDRRWGFKCCRIVKLDTDKPTDSPTNEPTINPTLEPTQPTTEPTKKKSVVNIFEIEGSTQEKGLEFSSYIIYVTILLSALIFILIAICTFHRKKSGSDPPGYIAVIRCCIEVIDLYTDIYFAWSIYLNGDDLLWYLIPFVIIIFAYVLNIFIALYKINTFKKSNNGTISGYMKSYDKIWLICTLIFGFYATFDLFTSHLFHLNVTSFQQRNSKKRYVKRLRVINFVLIENCGLIIIQILYLSHISAFAGVSNNNISSQIRMTLISMLFSTISIMSGLLMALSGLIYYCSSKTNTKQYFSLEITSNDVDSKHIHSHCLVSIAISKSIGIHKSCIETLDIVQKSNGIYCKMVVNVCNDHDNDKYNQLFTQFDSIQTSLRKELQSLLKMTEIENISIQRIEKKILDNNSGRTYNVNIMNVRDGEEIEMNLKLSSNHNEENEVYEWLNSIGLSQYFDILDCEGYECVDDLLTLDENDLVKINITKQMHIKKILKKSK